MDLNQLADALNKHPDGLTILIHGDPTTGKTELAATIAKVSWIKRVAYIGLDNGHATMVSMLKRGKLTPDEAKKFIIIKVEDTPDLPLAYETTFKLLTIRKPQSVCIEHGRVDCQSCKKDGKEFQTFDITTFGKEDAIILDTASQLADSMMNYYCKGKSDDYKPGWDEYGPMGRKLAELFTLIQAGRTNWIVCTQSIGINMVPGSLDAIAKPEDKVSIERIYPLCGSQNFSIKFGKYFRHKVYTEIKLGKHKAGSSSTYKAGVSTGSSLDWEIEKLPEPRLDLLLEKK